MVRPPGCRNDALTSTGYQFRAKELPTLILYLVGLAVFSSWELSLGFPVFTEKEIINSAWSDSRQEKTGSVKTGTDVSKLISVFSLSGFRCCQVPEEANGAMQASLQQKAFLQQSELKSLFCARRCEMDPRPTFLWKEQRSLLFILFQDQIFFPVMRFHNSISPLFFIPRGPTRRQDTCRHGSPWPVVFETTTFLLHLI